ncbi:MAG: N-acetylmuramoyl-L-alanine amidase [Bacillota bacterium]|nr:N-acetylmuramoyl-L-alanine amidase [Bacillota bacterium]
MTKASVINDGGHGGKDPGTTHATYQEKIWTLEMSLYRHERLKELGFNSMITRDSDIHLMPSHRTDIIKTSGSKICLSDHINSADNTAARGVETIHSVFSDGKLARMIYEEIIKEGMPGRRVFSRYSETKGRERLDYYFMHRDTGSVQTIIIESGFMSNAEDRKFLAVRENRIKLVEATIRGLCRYLGVVYKLPEKTASNEMTVIIVDKLGNKFNLPLSTGKLIDGNWYFQGRDITGKAGGVTTWNEATRTATFDFSSKPPPQPKGRPPKFEEINGYNVITAEPDQLEVALVKGKLPRDGINGGYLDGNLNPLGITIINGKIIADRVPWRAPRTVFVIDKGKAEIVTAVEKASDLAGVDYALGAGPLLVPNINHNEEFQDDIMKSSRPRSAIGITDEGLVKIVATRHNVALAALATFIRSIGCIKAMNLDGGGSVNLKWQNKDIIKGGAISTAILIK